MLFVQRISNKRYSIFLNSHNHRISLVDFILNKNDLGFIVHYPVFSTDLIYGIDVFEYFYYNNLLKFTDSDIKELVSSSLSIELNKSFMEIFTIIIKDHDIDLLKYAIDNASLSVIELIASLHTKPLTDEKILIKAFERNNIKIIRTVYYKFDDHNREYFIQKYLKYSIKKDNLDFFSAFHNRMIHYHLIIPYLILSIEYGSFSIFKYLYDQSYYFSSDIQQYFITRILKYNRVNMYLHVRPNLRFISDDEIILIIRYGCINILKELMNKDYSLCERIMKYKSNEGIWFSLMEEVD